MQRDDNRLGAGIHPSLAAASEILWPGHEPVVVRDRPSRIGEHALMILPDRSNPRLLLPTKSSLASTALLEGSTSTGLGDHLARLGIAGLARTGLHRHLRLDHLVAPPKASSGFVQRCADVTGQSLTWAALRLGSTRPNQKPVVMMGDSTGRIRTFAKVGWNNLTNDLVTSEAATLVALQDARKMTAVSAPRLMASTDWNGHTTILLEPLPIRSGRTATSTNDVAEAILAISTSTGFERMRLGDWVANDVQPRLARHAVRPEHDRLEQALDSIARQWGTTFMACGRWHGDFRPWNLSPSADTMLVWDWERSHPRAPLGLDALHFHFQIPRADEPLDRFHRRMEDAQPQTRRLLSALGIDDLMPALAPLHLVEMALRELDDVSLQPEVARDEHTASILELLERVS